MSGSRQGQGQPVSFDRRLVRKYDGPGPRYTSYPTAPAFRDSFGPEEHAFDAYLGAQPSIVYSRTV